MNATTQETVVDRIAQQPTRQHLPCVHCGLPTVVEAGQAVEPVFCCSGCKGAYQLIQGWGLADFYALRDQMKLTGTPQAASRSGRYEQFDSPDFLGPSNPTALSDGSCQTELAVHGLHCGACAWLIENAAASFPGLHMARVKMSDHTLGLVFDPQQTKLSQIAAWLDSLGYGLAPIDPRRDDHIQRVNRRLLIQIAIAGFLAVNAMWIAVALYAGEFSGVEQQHSYFMGLFGTVLGVAAVVGPGRTFFSGAWASLRTWTPHMDLPVALGLGVGAMVGSINAILGRGHIYFDSLATLVFFLLIGRWIQFRQQQRAARTVDLMLRITPRHANVLGADDQEKTVLVDTLQTGDIIRVAAGEPVAADGQVVRGESSLDRSLLTGESQPIAVAPGEAVAAGMVNLTAPIDVQVTATGRQSRIGRVMQSVEAAAMEKTPIVQLADRVGGVFVMVVTALAVATFAYWLPSGWSLATSHATALLIVACPCALALATPLAIAVGLGRAAKRGILIRDGQTLQKLSHVGTVWFDKTGTLTEGRQRVASVFGDLQGLQWAAPIEAACRHPVAQAIVEDARQRGLSFDYDAQLECVTIGGIVGRAAEHRVCVGNEQFMREQGIELEPRFERVAQQLASSGESPVWIAVDQQVVTLIGLTDPLRSGVRSMLSELAKRGWQLGMLSGDHPEIVQRVAAHLGLPAARCHGGLTPEEKLAAIRQSRQLGQTVIMVGDGANDAAALAAADCGVALRGGAEVSLQAAPVFVASGQPSSLLTLVRGARSTTRLIMFNFALSLSYNSVAVGLAMCGLISPLVAAILMPISSISVLALTLAWRSFVEEAV